MQGRICELSTVIRRAVRGTGRAILFFACIHRTFRGVCSVFFRLIGIRGSIRHAGFALLNIRSGNRPGLFPLRGVWTLSLIHIYTDIEPGVRVSSGDRLIL